MPFHSKPFPRKDGRFIDKSNEEVASIRPLPQPETMRTSKRGRGKHPVEELRKKIGKMWDAGATQREIADRLQVPAADVRYQLQKFGVPAGLQHKSHPVVDGKRVCVQCEEKKRTRPVSFSTSRYMFGMLERKLA